MTEHRGTGRGHAQAGQVGSFPHVGARSTLAGEVLEGEGWEGCRRMTDGLSE